MNYLKIISNPTPGSQWHFYNGFKEADTSRNVIMGKLETKEIEKAKALSTEYIEKYHTNLNGDDTDRDKECKHLYP